MKRWVYMWEYLLLTCRVYKWEYLCSWNAVLLRADDMYMLVIKEYVRLDGVEYGAFGGTCQEMYLIYVEAP